MPRWPSAGLLETKTHQKKTFEVKKKPFEVGIATRDRRGPMARGLCEHHNALSCRGWSQCEGSVPINRGMMLGDPTGRFFYGSRGWQGILAGVHYDALHQ